MEFYINWRYPLTDNNDEGIYTQILTLNGKGKVDDTPLKYVGMDITNLYNACKVNWDTAGYSDSKAYFEWIKIVGRKAYLQVNHIEKYEKSMLFDSITYTAYCVYKNVRTMLEEVVGNGFERFPEDLSECTKNILGEFNNDTILRPDEIQTRIDKYIEDYNKLAMSFRGNFDREFYDGLANCLKKYNENRLIAQYLSSRNEKGRCFATYIKDATQEKYISLSGFCDAQDNKILNWLGEEVKQDFLDILEEISNSMGAKYIPINLQTRRYGCDRYHPINVVQSSSLDDIIDLQIKNQKKYYACCERKIFGYFNDNTPSGKLYVKMKICGECILGLCYQMKNGEVITLFDGLEC